MPPRSVVLEALIDEPLVRHPGLCAEERHGHVELLVEVSLDLDDLLWRQLLPRPDEGEIAEEVVEQPSQVVVVAEASPDELLVVPSLVFERSNPAVDDDSSDHHDDRRSDPADCAEGRSPCHSRYARHVPPCLSATPIH